LSTLLASLDQFTRLTACGVGNHHLTSLPESLWQLTNLRTINVQMLADVMQAALADVTDAVHVEREKQA
jgi:lipoate-protein ligase B